MRNFSHVQWLHLRIRDTSVEVLSRNQVWWYILVIPAFGTLRQEEHEFKASLGYMVDFVSKTKGRKERIQWTLGGQDFIGCRCDR
jgi:hypothetical protein